jgi:16S rRNA (cytosine967-C5)-methyltransferase
MARSGSATVSLAVVLRDAAQLVARVASGRSLSAELERGGMESAAATRPALLDLCYGALRRYGHVQAIVAALSDRGRADLAVQALLWCALYALESGRYADYTVVDQAVRACDLAKRSSAKGYVNALLRAYLRDRDSLERRVANDPEARYRHPRWWIERVRQAYPGAWEQLLEADNTHPPMCLRVNRRRTTPEIYAGRLAEGGIRVQRQMGDCGLLLAKPVPVEQLPGFAEGHVSVQDAGAQLAAKYLDLAAGQRVLDACAAPGGKTAHILESSSVTLTALEIDPLRRVLVERNLERLGLQARVMTADCAAVETWWDGAPFERILADVPCTASGVVRRHPDIKWLRRGGDIEAFAARQARILAALWRVLAQGGKLLYVTCSVFPEENEAVLDAFCTRTPGAERRALPAGAPAQLLPGPEHDGFYFAVLVKR